MGSAWGNSWGNSWGDSWGALIVELIKKGFICTTVFQPELAIEIANYGSMEINCINDLIQTIKTKLGVEVEEKIPGVSILIKYRNIRGS